jgi:hypothetical protein
MIEMFGGMEYGGRKSDNWKAVKSEESKEKKQHIKKPASKKYKTM